VKVLKQATPPSLLQRADQLINGERRQQYGDPAESFAQIAALWSAYLGVTVTAHDYANMMILMKVSRARSGYHDDCALDIAGYAGLTELLK
jgi:hypothetical protein